MEQKTSFYTSYFSRLADSGEETPDFEGDFYKKLEAVMVDPKRNDYRLDLWNLQYRLEHDSSFRQEYRGWMEQCFLSACQLDGHGESVESIHPRLPDMKEKFEGARLTDKELALLFNQAFEPKDVISLLLKDTKRLRGENPLRTAFKTAAMGAGIAGSPILVSSSLSEKPLPAFMISIGILFLTAASVIAEEASSSIRHRASMMRREINDYNTVRNGGTSCVPPWQRDKILKEDHWQSLGL